MKIAAKAISAFLDAPQKSSVASLFYGPDSGLARERSEMVVASILGKKPDPLSILDVNEARILSDPPFLADEISAFSFLAAQRIIIIRDATDKLTKILENIASLLRKEVFLIILSAELGPRSSLRLWFEKSATAAAVACYHDEESTIGDYLRKNLRAAGISCSEDVVHYLISQLGNDRYVTRQEIQKIITYVGNSGKLSLEDAAALVGYNKEAEIDAAINALADKRLADLDKAIMLMVKEYAPVQYIRSMSRYFQRLYSIKLQSAQTNIEEVISGLRPPVFFRQIPSLTRHVRQWQLPAIAKVLALLNEAELACKSSDLPAIAASERILFKAATTK